MKNRGFVLRTIATIILSLQLILAYAQSTPKFAIEPTTNTSIELPANGVAIVKYRVTNLTDLNRPLVMGGTPIVGVSQLTSYPMGTGEAPVCNNPFYLLAHKSCTLVLQILAPAAQGPIKSDVIVCLNDGRLVDPSDPFLCTRNGKDHGLDIRFTTEVKPATIVAEPAPNLVFSVVGGGAVKVTNTSLTGALAENVMGSVPTNASFFVATDCPAHLMPFNSCYVYYNSNVPGTAQSVITGQNTNSIPISMEAIDASIEITSPVPPAPLVFAVGTSGMIIVKNSGSAGAVFNLQASITSGPFFVTDNTCPTFLNPGASCAITVSTLTNLPLVSGTVTIKGDNTPALSVNLQAQQVNISASPTTLGFAVGASGVVTITNNQPPSIGNALAVAAQIPLGSPVSAQYSNCNIIPPGSSCTITFTATGAADLTIPIVGSNTNTLSVAVTAKVPTVTVSPSVLQFVNSNVGTVTVTVPVSSFPVTGINAYPVAPITIYSNGCVGTLSPGGVCTISFTAPQGQTISQQSVPIYGTGTNVVGVNVTAGPAPISISPDFLLAGTLNIGSTTVKNNATGTATSGTAFNIFPTIPSGANISSSGSCASVAPQGTCDFTFSPTNPGVSNTVAIPIQGTNTTAATLTVAPIQIGVSPANLTISETNPGTLTITQIQPSPALGYNISSVTVGIPAGSAITVDPSSTCLSNATSIGHSTCTIVLDGGPLQETQVLTMQGVGTGGFVTNQVTATVTSIAAATAQLEFVGGVSTGIIDVDTFGATAVFNISNNSTTAATNITATLPPNWSGVTATPSAGCASLGGGSSNCTITLASSTANLPGTIEIFGTSTTTLQANVAFEKGNGLVYDIGLTEVKVVDPNVQPSTPLAWGSYILTNATSKTDGSVNQSQIMLMDPTAPAASFCNNYNAGGHTDWYLPAINELSRIYIRLAALGFGNFASAYYWSSTENDLGTAWYLSFVTGANGATNVDYKNIAYNLRCVRKA